MNVLTLTDHQLTALQQALANEARRRSQLAVNGRDPAALIYGNEAAKRAATLAAAGQHSILFIGPSNSGKTMLRALSMELGVDETYEARPCPCGNYDDPRAVCTCTVEQVESSVVQFPLADITVQVVRPRDRDMTYRGTSIAEMRDEIARMSRYSGESLDQHAATLLKAATRELPLDLVAVARILRLSRTIANLDQCELIAARHVAEAINYRSLTARPSHQSGQETAA